MVPAGLEGLVGYLARSLVDRPEQVEVRSSEVEGAQLIELKVSQDDVGKVIGRDGRTVNAIRTLLSVAAQRQGKKARLEIADDRRVPTKPNGAAPGPAPEPAPQ